jgi:hypothetical protein
MKQLLPIGIQDFATIRENGYRYVDKTALIHGLATGSGRAFFLSRPRRFGKSLLCSTLDALFDERRELFGAIAGQPALAIDALDWEWKKYPVIRLDLNAGDYTAGISGLYSALSRELTREAYKQNLRFYDTDIINQFAFLIEKSSENYGEKAVVIIDEYDKPLLSVIDMPEIRTKTRNVLKAFYGILKSYNGYLRFVFLTGVTKFSHVSIFSDLNNLDDITLNPRYADLCGITQKEVEQNFDPEINTIVQCSNMNRKTYIKELKRFYNGYRFSENHITVYNPFGLLQHFDRGGKFLPYWYDTGTPTFLVKLITEQKINILNLNKLRVTQDEFSKYDIAAMRAESLLYQSGYLTITGYDEELKEFTLDYPNDEVRASFAKSLMEQYFQSSDENSRALSVDLPRAIIKGNVDAAMDALRSFLASIPYDIIKEKENYYQTAVHLIFTMLGLQCRSEVRIASGRIDTLVETKNFVYCFEFKLNGSADDAILQIDTKKYLLPWEFAGKTLYKIGAVFDTEKHNIGEWKMIKSISVRN